MRQGFPRTRQFRAVSDAGKNSPSLTTYDRRCKRRRSARVAHRYRGWRRGRRSPGNAIEIKKLQHIGHRCIPVRQMRPGNKPVFDKLNHRGVVYRCVRNVMPEREWRDDDVRQTKPELRCESIFCCCVG